MKTRISIISWIALVSVVVMVYGEGYAAMAKVTIEYLVNHASLIVVGRVSDLKSRLTPEKTTIYTDVTVSVDQYIKGYGSREVTLTIPGGKVGNMKLWVEETPIFKRGEAVFLFLQSPGQKDPLRQGMLVPVVRMQQ